MPAHIERAILISYGFIGPDEIERAKRRQARQAIAQWRQQWRQISR